MGRSCPAFRTNRFGTTVLTILTFISSGNLFAAGGEQLIDKIVALVDSEVVLYSNVKEKVDVGPLVTVSDFPSTEDSEPYERALNDAINYELIIQTADELEIEITDAQVEQQIDRLLEGQNLTRAGLHQFLEQQGKTYKEYKADFQNQMLLRRFQGRVIAPLVKITDKDVETFYLKQTGNKADGIKFTLRQILIRVDANAPESVVEAKDSLATEIYQKLTGGTDFVEAVNLYSDGPSARSNGGLMSGVSLSDLNQTIRGAVEPLNEGQFSEPIKTSLGYHIFYLEKKEFSGSDEYLSKKRELEFQLRTSELNAQTRRWLQQARQRSKIVVLAESSGS